MKTACNREKGYWAGVISAIGLFVILSARYITLPGIHHDELLPAIPAIHLIKGETKAYHIDTWACTIAGRTFPIMVMEYMGSLKSYLLAGVFSLFGTNVVSFRLTGILVSVLGLMFMARFAAENFGWKVALFSVWLVATDPSFIIFTKTDFGPIAIPFLLRMAALFYLMRWWQTPSLMAALIVAGALLGLGIYDKVDFLWFVIALCLVTGGFHLMSITRVQGNPKYLLFALIAGLATSAPFWLYNLTHHWITFRMAAMPGQKISITNLIEQVPIRYRILTFTLNGEVSNGWMFDANPLSYFGISSTLLIPFSAVAMIILLAAAILTRRQWLAVFPILMWIMLVQIFLIPRLIWAHHFLGLYPFPHLSVALMFALVLPTISNRSSYRKLLSTLGSFCILIAVCINLIVVTNYHRLMRETGGTGLWSDAIYQLAEALKTEYGNRPIQVMDWGINNQLFFLSAGELDLREFFWFQPTSHATDQLLRLIADPKNVFVLHAPLVTAFPNARAALYDAARRCSAVKTYERDFYDRSSQLVYTIVEFKPIQNLLSDKEFQN